MEKIKTIITEQLQQLQMFMHRSSFHGRRGRGGKHNPHRGQGRILSLLKMKQEISQRELSYLLDMSRQSLAELLAKLEANGYITREPSEDDKRTLTVQLTADGQKAADEIDNTTSETPQVLDCLTDDELQAFSGYLDRIVKAYEAQYPDEDFEERRKMMEEFRSGRGHGHGHGHGGRRGHGHGGYHGKREHHNWKNS